MSELTDKWIDEVIEQVKQETPQERNEGILRYQIAKYFGLDQDEITDIQIIDLTVWFDVGEYAYGARITKMGNLIKRTILPID